MNKIPIYSVMGNGNDFKGGSPWGSLPGCGNGSGRGGQKPHTLDEVIAKNTFAKCSFGITKK